MVGYKIRPIRKFYIALSYGLFGVAYDWDHAVSLLYQRLPLTWYNLSVAGTRFAHIPIALLLGIICCSYSAYIFRLYHHSISDIGDD